MKRLILLLLLLLPALAVTAWLYGDMQEHLDSPLEITSVETLHIKPGRSLSGIGRDLERRGWIRQSRYLSLHGRIRGVAGSIKAGEYLITPGTTPRQLLDLVITGQVVQHSLTILEGWTFRQVIDAVKASPHLTHTLHSYRPRVVMSEIGRAGHFAEGRFYPDTYHFPRGTLDIDFLARANSTLEKILETEWQSRDTGLPYHSSYEALIMASIIEKETALAQERTRIAGVFVRRLQKGMKLQTDPTVIYAMGLEYDGNIRRKDLDIDSPYNTYRYTGLPPTPIAVAGRESISAALHPEPGSDLYFVARGDGSHEFSATLKQHNAAVRKYQLQRNR